MRKSDSGEPDLVMITVGSADGVAKGDEFLFHRDNSYLVTGRVEQVFADQAAVRLLPDSWKEEGIEIAVGDRAQRGLF